MSEKLVFGLVPPPSFVGLEPRLSALFRFLGERAGVTLVRKHVSSYDELVKRLRRNELDVAWLPPIPFVRLDGENVVNALVCAERGSDESFVSVLVTRESSTITSLPQVKGKKIGWVDPLSTTGYVVPRMRLAGRFKDEPKLFSEETFFGSHAALVRAVLDGVVDVGATYAGFSDQGVLVRGAFAEVGAQAGDLRVVEAFGAIPTDVIAIRSSIDAELQEKLAVAFEATSEVPMVLDAVRAIFGAFAFARKPLVGYDMLRAEIEHGVDSGVIPAASAFLSTRPPPANE